MEQETRVELRPEIFADRERLLVEHGELSASTFRFDSGVAAVRIRSRRGEIVALPYQGQQIWDARFDGRVLTMRTRFDQPRQTRAYLETYGAFLIHCGATGMGDPGPKDPHPLHGELPNAPYDSAYLAAGASQGEPWLAVGGEFRHTVAFGCDYVARPRVTIRASSTVMHILMEIENLANTTLDLLYLAHINFRPVDDGRLVGTAPCTPQAMRVRMAVPPAPGLSARHLEFLSDLQRDPSRHLVLRPGLAFDPQVVMALSCRADESGWARSMMIHPDGAASYVGHKVDPLDHAIRWISRTADQDCLGLLLPGTAEVDGYTAEKAKGNVKSLPGGATLRMEMEAGLLEAAAAAAMEKDVQRVMERKA